MHPRKHEPFELVARVRSVFHFNPRADQWQTEEPAPADVLAPNRETCARSGSGHLTGDGDHPVASAHAQARGYASENHRPIASGSAARLTAR